MAKATSSTTGGTSSRDSSILGKNLHPVSGSFAARKMSKSGKIWWKTHAGDCNAVVSFLVFLLLFVFRSFLFFSNSGILG